MLNVKNHAKPLNPQAKEWKPKQHIPLNSCWLLFPMTHFYYNPFFVVNHPDNVGAKCQKRPLVVDDKSRLVPPRLRRAAKSFPPAAKLQWKVKVSEKLTEEEEEEDSLPFSSNTTVMIKNIPNQLRRDFMLKFLDEYSKEHSLEYDFLYLPMDFRRKDNLGYAFVNFTTSNAAFKFKKIVNNFKWENVHTDEGYITSKKICEITWARIQGKEALIKRFENSSFLCDQLDFLPVLLDPPRNGSNPDPNPPVVLGKLSLV